VRFLDPSGQVIPTAPEWRPAYLDLERPPEEWGRVVVRRNGAELPVLLRRLGGQPRLVAEWPRSDPGRYALAVEFEGIVERQEILVPPRKIGQASFGRLLEELDARLPTAIALALQRCGALAGTRILPPAESTFAQELHRLRRAVEGTDARPGLMAVFAELARDSHRVLRTDELWARAERARRPHPGRLALAVARPHNLGENGWPTRVVDQRVEHTHDVYENRLVKAYADEVAARLRRLGRALVAAGQSVLGASANRLLEQLGRALREASFLDDVAPLTQAPTQLTMVLLRRPPYRAAFEGYLELHRSATVRLDEPRLDAPLENLPALYQAWGTLLVVAALLDAAADTGFAVQAQQLVRRSAGGFFVRVLPDGHPAVELTRGTPPTVVRLIPECSFRATGELRSSTYVQRPDVVVEIRRPDQPPLLYIFDPKYKLDGEAMETTDDAEIAPVAGGPKKVDIDKMHAYRDAIRAADGSRAVAYAAILYPGPHVTFPGAEIEAISAIPGVAGPYPAPLAALFARMLT
jgi:hypothetical protein